MNQNRSPYRFWPLVLWSLLAALLLVLMLLPVGQNLLSWDDGFAQAGTGPPPRPTKPPHPPGPPGHGPIGCPPHLPPGLRLVDHLVLDVPPAGIPPVPPDMGAIFRIPAALVPVPPLGSLPVPGGVLTEPVAVLPMPLQPFFCSLIVPTEPVTDLVVRFERLPLEAPIPLDRPGVFPRDWYLVPQPEGPELGYGAPIPRVAPGVVETNYACYAELVGLPTAPVPPPDAIAAGVLPTLSWQGEPRDLAAVFKLNVYNAETGQEITIHLPELVLVVCGEFERELIILRANTTAGRYDMPVQNLGQEPAGDFRDRLRAYFLETSTFVILRVSGQIPPPLASGQQAEGSGFSIVPSGLPRTGAALAVHRPPALIYAVAGLAMAGLGLVLYWRRLR